MPAEMFEFAKELINNGLFPILACIVMFYQNKKQRESLDSFKDSVASAMAEQTRNMTILAERMQNFDK